jgi:lipoate-protein ligase A
MRGPIFHLLDLTKRKMGIFQQLKIEEALFRTNNKNWIIFNSLDSIKERAVVFGLGDARKPDTLCNVDIARNDGIALIKRYSGGGTVFVDKSTRFITFICNDNFLIENDENNRTSSEALLLNFPRPIMEWTGELYKDAFDHIFYCNKKDDNNERELNLFNLRENDYIFDDRKFGGNAQSISKNRWVHHTSFLYDYNSELMNKYLLLPTKQPEYREQRDHNSFLCKLKDIFPEHCPPNTLENAILQVLQENRKYNIISMDDDDNFEAINEIVMEGDYRKSNVYL